MSELASTLARVFQGVLPFAKLSWLIGTALRIDALWWAQLITPAPTSRRYPALKYRIGKKRVVVCFIHNEIGRFRFGQAQVLFAILVVHPGLHLPPDHFKRHLPRC